MRQRPLFSLVSFVIIILIGTFAMRAVQADGYYWRWTSVPDAECSNDGNDYLETGHPFYEYNLPASGTVIHFYRIDNGVSSSDGDDSGFSGSGTGFYGESFVDGIDPFTFALQADTEIDGEVVYRSTITYKCVMTDDLTGETTLTITITNQDFGAGECLPLPVGSVVGDLPNGTQAFYAPGKISPDIFINPGTYWVLGEDESGQYYKILLACQYLWVPVETMQPSYQSPWTGQPLPTLVVS